jgi:hypothetical protein
MSRNSQLNKSSANRRQQKKDKRMIKFAILAVVLLVIFLVIVNYRSVIAPLEGIGRNIGRNSSDAGFPVRLPGSAGYSINPFDGGFMLLTETYIYTYDADGGFNYAYQHAYGTPKVAVNDRRILLYDENGRRFSFLWRGGLIFERDSEERILYGTIGQNNDRVAIVYRDAVYANLLEIYDSVGDWRYRKRFADENIMQIAFAASDNEIIVSSIGFNSVTWDVTATVRRFDTSTDDDAIWTADLAENTLPFALHVTGNYVYVLCDNVFYVLNFNDGREIGRFSYSGDLIDFAFSDEGDIAAAILVNDFSTGTMTLISLDRTAELIGSESVSSGASQVEIHLNVISVLEPTFIAQFSSDLSESDTTALNEEYTRFIHLGDDILLLGFNTVSKAGEDIDSDENED